MKNVSLFLSASCLLSSFFLQAFPRNLLAPADDASTEENAQEAGPAKSYKPSPEPSLTDEKSTPEKTLEGLERGGGRGKKILVVEVKGVIDLGLSSFIERQLHEGPDAALVVLDIDTPGGRVDAALKIRDALLGSKVKTAAFIHPRAISAGALISYACDIIAISTGGSIGAATPIDLSGGKAEAVDEKMLSYFRTEMASTARAKGRRGDLAEAMVDKDISIDGVTEGGKLLTLDTDNALRLKVADLRADSLGELLEELNLEGADIARPKMGWAEKLARWLTHPVVSGLLMTVGILAILIELYHPGFGAPGVVGIVCLALFFFGHLVVHLAGWEELLLLGVGVVLLLLEIFVTPGHGFLGILGVLMIVASFTMALTSLPLTISFETGMLRHALIRTIISVLASIGLFLGAFQIIPRLKFAHPLVEKAAIFSRAHDVAPGETGPGVSPGDEGKAASHLRPSGRALFRSRTVEVIAEGSFIDEGSTVVVIKIEGSKIIVREK